MFATHNDAMREWARYTGTDRPDRQWLLHDCDVWVINPCYFGPDQGHPECSYDDYEDPDYLVGGISSHQVARAIGDMARTLYLMFDDVPF